VARVLGSQDGLRESTRRKKMVSVEPLENAD
jgi:hypothetical protein